MNLNGFQSQKIDDYAAQAKALYGKTEAYREYEEKSKDMTDTQQKDVINSFMLIFAEFGKMQAQDPASDLVQDQVKKLQDFISKHYYTCTKEILSGLGKMYVADGEFTDNIDSYGGEGTAVFTAKAIEIYCK